MRKFLFIIFALFIISSALVYFGSGFAFDYAAKKALPRLLPHLQARGIDVHEYAYSSIRLSSLRTVTAYDASASVSFKAPEQDEKSYQGQFYAERVNFHVANLRDPAVYLSSDNFHLSVDQANVPGTSFGRFEHGYIQLRDPIRLSDPRAGLRVMLQKVADLFNETEVEPNVIMRALVTLNVGGKEAQAYLHTRRSAGGTQLCFEEKDIRSMADTFELDLSNEEVSIIASYPAHAPIIMHLTSEAKATSRTARRRDGSVPEDAYRHVLWSYLLTRRFGPEFAEKVTDAHEKLPTNTAAERKMDFHNNRVGRDYARRGVPQERILSLVMSDPGVIRRPEGG
ncbi:hypothetical protein JXA02_11410 [candidate division KSB1 bacterium]|nr:hypothetical protein [candidate division KSB1 bacterium]RQW02455.1 MAG: hypothetical protein EH222_13635 [candidate division KSB1 bacterium]